MVVTGAASGIGRTSALWFAGRGARARLIDLVGSTPAWPAAFMRAEAERWNPIIRTAGIRAE